MMKPEPSELTRRGERLGVWSSPPWPRRFLKNSSKNSSNGEPGGSCGIAAAPPPRASTFCEVEMLTTASITFSATSAMFSGPRANVGVASVGQREHSGGNRGQGRLPDGMRESGEQAGHGRQFS